jgi:hypothetical protein
MPFSGGNRAEIPQKQNKMTDKQTDLTVIWDTKSTKTDFRSDPKSVNRKNQKTWQTSRQTVSRFGFLGHPSMAKTYIARCDILLALSSCDIWTGTVFRYDTSMATK